MGKLFFVVLLLVMAVPSRASAEPPEIKTLKTDSFTMEYFCFGTGKKTLVILPGVSTKSVMNYADAVAESYKLLTDDFTIYVLDRKKEFPPRYSVSEMADDTAEAIKALNLGSFCIFGASQGGMIAMKIAIEYPELVQRMILGSTSARVSKEHYKFFERMIQLAKAGDSTALNLAFGEFLYPKNVFEASKELLIESAKTETDEDRRRFIIMTEALKDFDITGEIKKISCPVLVIGSSDDKVLGGSSSAEIMNELKGRPGCEFFMYDSYGHAAYDIAPDYRERMLKFLR